MSTPDENLRDIALFITQPVGNALSASFVMHAADAYYEKHQSRFARFVGNTMTYRCLYALEGQSMIEIAEIIANKKDPPEIANTGPGERFPLSIEVRGKPKLLNHRDMLCHPMVLKWRRVKHDNQAFADAGHKWNAVRAGLAWDVLKQINERLRVAGFEVYVDDVPVIPEMGAMLGTILESAGLPLTDNQSDASLFEFLKRQKSAFIGILDQFPDGIITEPAVTG